ncbi:MAG TPA: xanthine dehydrogenase family protein molybdopterin-binding subunit [Rhodanobacteraceae bacterium]|jgi:isoquinoline 1-oxidoreductase beta subunit|nr:xanthine dehydrogenase family protein molybdopterin-binding subunit [Rhodanobacteraceae bacterium]
MTEALIERTPHSASRRAFLKTGAAATGGVLLFGFRMPFAGAAGDKPSAAFAPNAFIRIDRQGVVTLIMPQVEMGQGVYTAVAMILAEELDANWDKVTLEHAPPSDKLYGNPVFGIQVTGNSNSIRAFWTPLRKAGASVRAMLVEAAARRWKVEPTTCRAENGEVIDASGSRKLAYGDLIDDASRIEPPKDPTLKPVSEFKLIGKPLKRLDTPDKVNGKAMYGIDVLPPGVKFATLMACPVFGGKVAHVDDTAAKAVPGVRQIVVLDDLVAVVGDHMWAAKQGLAALDVSWDEGANAAISSADVWAQIRAASEKTGVVAKTAGDAAHALTQGERLDAAYEVPFLAHATMEPMNCTVHVRQGECEVWVGSQVIARAQSAAAKLTGFPLEKVIVHNHLIGGGFGRRLEVDMVEKAVRIAQKVDSPVKVVWTREEDIRHDVYRPVYRDVLSASVADGRIVGWSYRITGSSIIARWLPPAFTKGIDIDSIDSAADIPYDIPNLNVEYQRDEPPAVPTGFWRGVGPNNNVFAIESFIDELAKKVGKDPVAFRRDILTKNPRLLAAVNLAAEKSGWGTPLPPRVGRGIAAQVAFASFIATVVEVGVDEDGEITLRRVVSAVDTGIAVNPDTIVAQLQGGIIFGLTAALYGEITIDKGRVQQSNFHDYRMLRINQVPSIEVHLIASGEAPGGIGETGTTAGPPALGNAIYAATGVRLRRLPIDRTALATRKPT